jgi:hypothetical protein
MLPHSILAALAWSAVSGNLALAAPLERDTPEWTSILAGPAETSPLNGAVVVKSRVATNQPTGGLLT